MYRTKPVQAAALVAMLATSAVAISYDTTCDAARNPNWDDCQLAFQDIDNYLSSNGGSYPIPNRADGNCYFFSENTCRVTVCDYAGRDSVPGELVSTGVDDLKQICKNNGAGGRADNRDGTMSVEIYAVGTSAKKTRRRGLKKRDTTWELVYTINNAAPDQYKQQVLNAQPGGSTWELSNTETQTNQVEVSVSISEDFFEIFQSSQSISYSYTETVETSTTATIQNTCANNQEGTLYWYPRFNQYRGSYQPDGPYGVDIYVPVMTESGGAAGEYRVVCSN